METPATPVVHKEYEQLKTLEEYFKTQQIPVDEISLGKTSELMITFTKTTDLSESI